MSSRSRVSGAARVDTGRRRAADAPGLWGSRPSGFVRSLTADEEAKQPTSNPSPTAIHQTEHVLTARSEATRAFLAAGAVVHHTPIVRELAAMPLPAPVIDSPRSLHASPSTHSLTSPRRRRAQMASSSSVASFVSPEGVSGGARVPTPPQARVVPSVLVGRHSAPIGPSLATRAHVDRLAELLAASAERPPIAPVPAPAAPTPTSAAQTAQTSRASATTMHPSSSAASLQVPLSSSASQASVGIPVPSVGGAASSRSNPDERYYFAPEFSAAASRLRVRQPGLGAATSSSNLLLLAPSASVGALPHGLTPSASHSLLGGASHVRSSPSMPLFGSSASVASLGAASVASNSGATPASATVPTTVAEALAAAYPAALTVDNSELVDALVRDATRSCRRRGSAASSSGSKKTKQEKKEGRGSLGATGTTSTTTTGTVYPRASWDRKGFHSVAPHLPFEALFGLEDSTTRWRRKKRERRLEEERRRRALFAESEMRDNERSHLVVASATTNTDVMDEPSKDGASSSTDAPHAMNGAGAPHEQEDEMTAAESDSASSDTNALSIRLDGSGGGGGGGGGGDKESKSIVVGSHAAARGVDPLDPHPRPSLLTAAARVLLRAELHPPTQDANRVAVAPPGTKLLVKSPPTLSTASGPGGGAGTLARNSLHELATRLTGDDDEALPPTTADGSRGGGDGDGGVSTSLVPGGVAGSDLVVGGGSGNNGVIDAARARGTFLEHSSRAYLTGGGARGLHGSHTARTAAAQARLVARDLKASVDAWLRVRARKHRRLMREEDRLRAREMFDMLLIATGASEDADSAAGGGGGGASSSSHGTSSSIPSSSVRDPGAARVDLESMRRVLHSLGMDASAEELAFRLQKLAEHHAATRANAAAGISSKAKRSHLAHDTDAGTDGPSSNGVVIGSSGHVNGAQGHAMCLTFNDFLSVYEHLSQWDELASFRRLKAARGDIKDARHNHRRQRFKNRRTRQQQIITTAAAVAATGGATSGSASEGEDEPHGSRTTRGAGVSGASSGPRAATGPPVLGGGSGGLALSVETPQGSTRRLDRSRAPSVSVSSSSPPLTLSTRTDETLRRIELPFFLWVPAAHRAERINEIVRLYGQPSSVAVADQQDKTDSATNIAVATTAAASASTTNTARRKHPHASSAAASSSNSPSRSRFPSVFARGGGGGGGQRRRVGRRLVGSSGGLSVGHSSADEGGDGVGGGGSSSDDELVGATGALLTDGALVPTNVERTLVDALRPTRVLQTTPLPSLVPSGASTAAPPSPAHGPVTPTNSSGASSASARRAGHARRISAAASQKRVSGGSQTSRAAGSTGPYWGSQQVLRAAHHRNISLAGTRHDTLNMANLAAAAAAAGANTDAPLPDPHPHVHAHAHSPHTTTGSSTAAANSSVFSFSRTPAASSPSAPAPSIASRRAVFVPPLRAVVVAPEVVSTSTPSSPWNDSSTNLAADSDSAGTSHALHLSTPVSEIRAALLASAERTEREVAELVRQVEAKLAGGSNANGGGSSGNAGGGEDQKESASHVTDQDATRAAPEEHTVATLHQADESTDAINKTDDEAVEEEKEPSRPTALSPLLIESQPSRGSLGGGTRRRTVASSLKVSSPTAHSPRAPAVAVSSSSSLVPASRLVPHPVPSAEEKAEVMALGDPMIKAAKSGAWEDALLLIQTSVVGSGGVTDDAVDVRARNAFLNRRDKNGSTAIFHAAWPGHFKVMEVLLYHGADPNVQNNRLNTALHMCTEKGHRKLIRLLIEMGARIDLRNWQNKTCLDVIPLDGVAAAAAAAAAAETPAVKLVPAGSTPSHDPTPAALTGALRSHAAAEASDSLKAFVLECAEEARRKREDANAGAGSGDSLASLGVQQAASEGTSFVEFATRRDAAAAASAAAASAAAASRSLLGPDGKPLVDLWELTAADRRAAGLRGNFFGADALQRGGQEQARTLDGRLLIRSAATATGVTASENAMGAYRASFVSDPVAASTRARIVSELVREELSRSTLHQLWQRTQLKVQSRATVITNTEELLKQSDARMVQLRQAMQGRRERSGQETTGDREETDAPAPATAANAAPAPVVQQ